MSGKTPSKKALKSTEVANTTAVHAHAELEDGMHVVGLGALRVLLTQDDGGWFAQGLEVDYAAAGLTVEEAKANFALGLELTIHEHLKVHGAIRRFLVPAPAEAWAEFFELSTSKECLKQTFTTIQLHQVEGAAKAKIPFDNISFLRSSEPECLAA